MKLNTYIALLITSSLVACGGGGGSSGGGISLGTASSSTTATTVEKSSSSSSSAAAAAVVQGMVTGFGSVIVNGIHYDVKDAIIDVDGNTKVESELGVGEMVRIMATLDDDGIHGKATKLASESQVRGPIDSIDLTNGVLVALGQSILINGDTFYQDGLTAESLKVGDIVKVNAYTNADGKLVATRIEVKTGSEAQLVLLTGKVASLDTTAMTFSLNGTPVDYSKASLNDLPNKTIANDLMVRVHGTMTSGVFVANGSIKPSALDLKHDGQVDTKASFELGGLVTNLVANTRFVVGDTSVLINSTTVVEGGTLADLANGVLVKVRGSLDADKNLVAKRLKVILQPKVEDEGLIQATDLTANTLTLNGVKFEITVDTSFNDRGNDKVRLFSLKDLKTGDYINVRGYRIPAANSTAERMIATRIERKKIQDKSSQGFKTELSGKIEAVNTDLITIAGRTVKVPTTTVINGLADVASFLANAVGLTVEIKGVIENNNFIARSIKIEKDETEEHHSSSSNSGHSESSHSASSHSESSRSESSHSESEHSESEESESSHSSTSSQSSSASSSSSII